MPQVRNTEIDFTVSVSVSHSAPVGTIIDAFTASLEQALKKQAADLSYPTVVHGYGVSKVEAEFRK